MSKLNGINCDVPSLTRAMFKGVDAFAYDGFQINDYRFNIKSETDFKFRLKFVITYFAKQNRIALSVLGEEKFGDFWLSNSSVTSAGTICKWVEEDFNRIASHLLKELHDKFSTADIGFNTLSPFVNNRLRELQQKIAKQKNYLIPLYSITVKNEATDFSCFSNVLHLILSIYQLFFWSVELPIKTTPLLFV